VTPLCETRHDADCVSIIRRLRTDDFSVVQRARPWWRQTHLSITAVNHGGVAHPPPPTFARDCSCRCSANNVRVRCCSCYVH